MLHRIFLLILIVPAVAFSYTVVRSDGRSFSGELIQQTPNETIIKDFEGVTMKFRANQIDWNQTTIRIRNEEEQRVAKAFLPDATFQKKEISNRNNNTTQWTGEPFSFDFKDIDIKDLFRFIADISGLNVILDPAVKGTVTLKLTEVPWDQALDFDHQESRAWLHSRRECHTNRSLFQNRTGRNCSQKN
ncbi:hypothetical protein L0156_06280 [bacterium]|nr:hypothetical protein [bacterium]